MSDTSNMAEFRVTIRLPADLYAQLQARGSHGRPLAAIVREALTETLLGSQPRLRASESLR
jgi:predicted DNA-binding protein